MPLLFAFTLFVSAVLLFLVQPMIARMILPLLGGSPAVWLTCMVFFQAVLLVGYLYAHGLTSRLGFRRQVLVHLAVLAVPLAALPLVTLPLHMVRGTPALYGDAAAWLGLPPAESNPVPWLLALLAVSVGLPFFAVSTSAPLLQKWFGGTAHAAARDPYFLYAASNAGSMAALLGYPLVVEPLMGLLPQSWLWSAGYGVLLGLVALCISAVGRASEGKPPARSASDGAGQGGGGVGGRKGKGAEGQGGSREAAADASPSVLSPWRRLRWLALSFVPSSLLFGVTTYLSTDIAAVPLLWVVPLALYLLTFILAFAPRRLVPHRWVALALPVLILVQLFVLLALTLQFRVSLATAVGLHLLTFFAAAFACHGELADDRPATAHLTEFYLWLSAGGVLGGLFNALLAPLVFTTVAEYPLALVAACLLGPAFVPKGRTTGTSPVARPKRKQLAGALGSAAELLGYVVPPTLGVLAGVLVVIVQLQMTVFDWNLGALMLGLPLACYGLAWMFSPRPLWFGAPVAVMLLAATTGLIPQGTILHIERGFYGILRVTQDSEGQSVRFYHGSTLHGKQNLTAERKLRRLPLTYYHPAGPVGQVFAEFSGDRAKKHVGVVGLGTGSLASYGQPGQEFTFYEIDPAVVRLAGDYFTFLKESLALVRIELGDARLALQRAADRTYGLLVIDAFSSDAIPVHLITREAVEEVYLRKLAADGVLAFHISNRHLDLRPVLANVAAELRLAGRWQYDPVDDEAAGRAASVWMVLAATEADLGGLGRDPRWLPLQPRPGLRVWTDDYSNILQVLRW